MALAALRPCLEPRCPALVRGGGRCQTHQRKKERERGTAHERGYDARWRKARLAFLRANPLCLQCEGYGRIVPATVVDHVVPHCGDRVLFWDQDNWQPLCARCHSAKTAAEDGGFGTAASLPSGLMLSRIPFTVVAGSPGSGKTTYVGQRAGDGDLVLDLDVIRAQLSGRSLYEAGPETYAPAMQRRNAQLARLGEERLPWPRAWLISSAPTRAARDWWRRKTGAHVVVVATTLEVCLERIATDGRRRNKEHHEQAARAWWSAYQPDPADEVA